MLSAPSRLRCEYLENPIGLDIAHPRLSWRMVNDARGARQTARQTQGASDPALLAADTPDLWESGKVEDDACLHVAYDGVSLQPRQRCWWRVRIWDEQGQVSPWSETAYWETGFLSEAPWDAEWISEAERDGKTSEPCPYLRRRFSCAEAPVQARLFVTALGLYECSINGRRVGDEWFTPGWTEYKVRIPYQTYDITDLVAAGENVVGAILGDGWASGEMVNGRARWSKQPFLKALLVLDYADGTTETIRTDERWCVTTGPLRASDIYNGETYDARLEMPGWDAPGYDDAGWSPAWVGPERDAKLTAKPGPNTYRIMEKPALSRSEPSPGVYIFDLGQNFAGRVRLRVSALAGTEITLRHGEMLEPDGTLYIANLCEAKATDRYICRGDGVETWEPRFTFHGFRYVEVTGCPTPPVLEDVTGIVLHSPRDVTMRFSCSNELVNKLQQCIEWSQRSNFLELPTDCPQRNERLGWTGDAQVFIPTACYTMDVAAFFTNWLQTLDDSQDEEGAFPHVAPDVTGWHGSAAWADAGVICPWTIYRFYGDTRILARHYVAMERWMAFMERTSRGLVRPEEGYGDWLNPEHMMDGSSLGPPPRNMIGTAYFARCAALMTKIARVLGRDEDAVRYADLTECVKAEYRRHFVLPNGRHFCGTASGKSQTAYLLTLAYNILDCEKEIEQAAFAILLELLAENDWHLRTGFVGTPLMNPTLTKMGRTDLAYRLLLQETCPSWLFPVINGATTTWEQWDAYTNERGIKTDAGLCSFNHYAYGAIGEWLYAVVGGIELDEETPAFKRIRIYPRPGEGIDHAEMTLDSPYGDIACRWRKDEDVLTLDVRIPPNTTAAIVLPCSDAAAVRVNGQSPTEADGVTGMSVEHDELCLNAVAGSYRIEVACLPVAP